MRAEGERESGRQDEGKAKEKAGGKARRREIQNGGEGGAKKAEEARG